MAVRADQYYWFNGVGDVDHTNWGAYWAPIISSGVLGNLRNEMVVTGNSTGMFVYVDTGECMIYGVRGIVETQATLPVAAADATYPRVDLVVARAVFLNEGESYVELDIKTGTPAASPTAPALTQTAAQTWEIPLAEVAVAASAVTITAGNVVDARVFSATSGGGGGMSHLESVTGSGVYIAASAAGSYTAPGRSGLDYAVIDSIHIHSGTYTITVGGVAILSGYAAPTGGAEVLNRPLILPAGIVLSYSGGWVTISGNFVTYDGADRNKYFCSGASGTALTVTAPSGSKGMMITSLIACNSSAATVTPTSTIINGAPLLHGVNLPAHSSIDGIANNYFFVPAGSSLSCNANASINWHCSYVALY